MEPTTMKSWSSTPSPDIGSWWTGPSMPELNTLCQSSPLSQDFVFNKYMYINDILPKQNKNYTSALRFCLRYAYYPVGSAVLSVGPGRSCVLVTEPGHRQSGGGGGDSITVSY